MPLNIKVKKEFEKTVVGFNNSGKPLGERDDLHLLLLDALNKDDSPRDQHILDMFDEVPSVKELQDYKDQNIVQKFKGGKPIAPGKELDAQNKTLADVQSKQKGNPAPDGEHKTT